MKLTEESTDAERVTSPWAGVVPSVVGAAVTGTGMVSAAGSAGVMLTRTTCEEAAMELRSRMNDGRAGWAGICRLARAVCSCWSWAITLSC